MQSQDQRSYYRSSNACQAISNNDGRRAAWEDGSAKGCGRCTYLQLPKMNVLGLLMAETQAEEQIE